MAVLELPVVEPELTGPRSPDEWEHRFCCDDEVALCGYRMPGGDWEKTDRCDDECCPICLAKERLHSQCDVPGCPGWS